MAEPSLLWVSEDEVQVCVDFLNVFVIHKTVQTGSDILAVVVVCMGNIGWRPRSLGFNLHDRLYGKLRVLLSVWGGASNVTPVGCFGDGFLSAYHEPTHRS